MWVRVANGFVGCFEGAPRTKMYPDVYKLCLLMVVRCLEPCNVDLGQ